MTGLQTAGKGVKIQSRLIGLDSLFLFHCPGLDNAALSPSAGMRIQEWHAICKVGTL